MRLSTFPSKTLTLFAVLALLALPLAAATVSGDVQSDAETPIADAMVRVSPAADADSFETDFDGWTFHTDLPDLSTVERTSEIAFDGTTSVRFETTGVFDDGTAWLQQSFSLAPNTTYLVNLSWFQTNLFTSDIGTWPVVAFAGTEAPTEEADFTRIGQDSQAEDFLRYGYTQTVTTDSTGTVYLAFGVSVVFEVDRVHFFDLARPSIVGVDDIQTTTTDADGDFSLTTQPGDYRVEAEKKGFLSDFTVPVMTGADDPTLTLIRLEDVFANELDHLLVESQNEKLFVFASLTTPTGVLLDGAQCLGRFELADGTRDFVQTLSDNGVCKFRFDPADGTVPRGPTVFELLGVEAEGKTYAPEKNVISPFKFTVE